MKTSNYIIILCMVILLGSSISMVFAVSTSATATMEIDSNRPGMDYKQMSVKSAEECSDACKADLQCKAFTLDKMTHLEGNPLPTCKLKNGIPAQTSDVCCVSGLITRHASQSYLREQNLRKARKPIDQASEFKKEQMTTDVFISGNEIVRECAETITVDNIPIHPENISPVPGFVGVKTGNEPATFTFLKTGKNSDTDCYCEYRLGELIAQMRIELGEYTKCNAGYYDKPGNGKIQVLFLDKQ